MPNEKTTTKTFVRCERCNDAAYGHEKHCALVFIDSTTSFIGILIEKGLLYAWTLYVYSDSDSICMSNKTATICA